MRSSLFMESSDEDHLRLKVNVAQMNQLMTHLMKSPYSIQNTPSLLPWAMSSTRRCCGQSAHSSDHEPFQENRPHGFLKRSSLKEKPAVLYDSLSQRVHTYNIKQFTSSCVTSGNLYGLLFQAWQHESFSLHGKQCSNVIFSVMWVNMLCLTCSPERLWRPVWSRRVLGGAPEIHIQHHPPSCCRLHRTPPSENWETHTAKTKT